MMLMFSALNPISSREQYTHCAPKWVCFCTRKQGIKGPDRVPGA